SARFAHARAFSGPARAFSDAVEVALADALQRAAISRRWDVASQLARELEARRLAQSSDKVVITRAGCLLRSIMGTWPPRA
ncbi:MAG: hypothetical protein VB934_20760, partial [Polyangiaceae bacterium]